MKTLNALVLSLSMLAIGAHAADSYEQALSKLQHRFQKKEKSAALRAKQKSEREQLKNAQKAEREALKGA